MTDRESGFIWYVINAAAEIIVIFLVVAIATAMVVGALSPLCAPIGGSDDARIGD